MSLLPVHKRDFNAFISYAHADKVIIDSLYQWLTERAGVQVWYDAVNLPSGQLIATYLPDAIAKCQSLVIVLSKKSVASGWVQKEYAAAERQPKNFRIIPVRIEECEPPGFLPDYKWISIGDKGFDVEACDEILTSMYYDSTHPVIEKTRDVYVSRTWREKETKLADDVCQQFIGSGYRLIGDARDQKHFGEKRVESIIASCGAFLSVIPNRPEADLTYFHNEVAIARKQTLPCLVVLDSGVKSLPDWQDQSISPARCISFDAAEDGQIRAGIDFIDEHWRAPKNPHYAFFASDLDSAFRSRNRRIQAAVQRVIASPCYIGAEIKGDEINRRLVDMISSAMMVLCDITNENVNACIEAGIARGAKRPLHMVAAGPRKQPPFMLRDFEIAYYENDAELLGTAHKVAYNYRRRVLNWELA